MRLTRTALAIGSAVLGVLGAAGCRREEPPPAVGWTPGGTGSVVRTTTLVAGGVTDDPVVHNPFADDARSIAEGRAVYEGFNCAGCHGASGGGGIGPPFADADWIYGSEPENIFQSVAQGRPNGMPSFGGKLPEETLWKIVAYVRSLDPQATAAGGQGGGSSAPGGGKQGVTQGAKGGGGRQ